MPDHWGNGLGGLNLKGPTGGWAYLIPLNARIRCPLLDSSMVPHSIPLFVMATGNSHRFSPTCKFG